jgi:hypothetical protein
MARHNYHQIIDALAKREPFTGNSMWAVYVDTRRTLAIGRLDSLDAAWFRRDQQAAHDGMHGFYVVYSYGTPIAWAYGDTVCIPDTKYSRTTSAQQTYARLYLAKSVATKERG